MFYSLDRFLLAGKKQQNKPKHEVQFISFKSVLAGALNGFSGEITGGNEKAPSEGKDRNRRALLKVETDLGETDEYRLTGRQTNG